MKTSSNTHRKRAQNVDFTICNDFLKLRHPNMSDQKWLRSRPGCPCFLLGLPFLPKPSNNKQTCNENLVERCVKKRTTHQHRINKTHKTLISVSVLLMILPHPIAGHVPGRSLSARSLVSPPITGPAECTKRSNTRFRVGAWPKALKYLHLKIRRRGVRAVRGASRVEPPKGQQH